MITLASHYNIVFNTCVLVFDFKELNIYEGNCTQPDAEVTISDENFFMVGSKQTTFDDLIADVI